MPDALAQIGPSKRLYGGVMAVVCAAAVGLTAGASSLTGGDSRTILLACAAVGVGAVLTFLPAFFGGPTRTGANNFGLLVLFASGARTLAILAVAMFFAQTREVVKSPFWIGTMSGAGLILIAESALAVAMLARVERTKTLPHAAQTV